ncbi:mannosyltransferase [Panus rudis PR-1116 ss-1]|nr:mannosyltransferase [Panus rudis PR-1116 ss-1]
MSTTNPPRLLSIRTPFDLIQYATLILTDRRYFPALAALVILGDAFLTQLIIRYVPYTEIDWETYMYQVELYMKGERDYAAIEGPTGPIVYPAGHVYIHELLYRLTDAGRNLAFAQQIYGLLYLASLTLTCAIYYVGGVPNWILLLLPLSKRLHSIFVLRLFNDCWSLVAVQAATLAYALGWDVSGTLLYGFALSVKMSVLLYLPGILVVLVKRKGLLPAVAHAALIILSQAVLGLPFLLTHPWSYLRYSYEFSRVFLYKWTVNWRFVSEETFLSSPWAKGLLLGHLSTLIAFGWFRWCRKDGGAVAVIQRSLRFPTLPPSLTPVTSDYVITVLWTSNLIGMIFARSLHYQFYSWYAQQLPFLLWGTRFPTLLRLLLLLFVEYSWNVYPSTSFSSGFLLASNVALAVGIFFGYSEGKTVATKTE